MKAACCMACAVLLLSGSAAAQVLTSTSEGTLSVSIPFGNLTPGNSSAPSSTQLQFRLRSNNDSGYKLQASAVFSVTPNGSPDGGTILTASDIGVGITSLTYEPAVRTPRVDTIAPGFNYNPATVPAVNGMTPYSGMVSGRATLADIVANPSMTILSGPKIANNQHINPPVNFITVTITFGVVGEFFTPAMFSGILTLTMLNGP